jgi:hypothetical protein
MERLEVISDQMILERKQTKPPSDYTSKKDIAMFKK